MGATATMVCGDTVSLILSRRSAGTRWSGQARWIRATRSGWASAAAAVMKQVWRGAPIDRASCTRRVPSKRQRPWACRWRRRRSLAASLICGLAGLVISFIQLSGAQATYVDRGRRHGEIGAYRMLTVLRSRSCPVTVLSGCEQSEQAPGKIRQKSRDRSLCNLYSELSADRAAVATVRSISEAAGP